MKKFLAAVLAVFCLTIGCSAPASASIYHDNPVYTFAAAGYEYNRFSFKDFTADYYLDQAADGTSRLLVREKLTAVFPETGSENHGITRIIPYTNQNGKNLTMHSDEVIEINVWQNGKSVRPYKVEGGDGYFMVYIGDPEVYVNGEQVYELEYEFINVITEFDEDSEAWQELYWDTNGNDWEQDFGAVTARVHFADEQIADNFTGKSWCYVGRYGDSGQNRCKISEISDGLEFKAQNLAHSENLTFDLEFKPDSFVVPGQTKDYKLVLASIIVLLVFIAEIVAIVVIYKLSQTKRKYYKGLFIRPEYTPPQDLTVGEMATNYIKPGKLGSSKVATLMELATHHKIEIIKRETQTKLGKTRTKWFIKVGSLDLSAEQVTILKILQGGTGSLSIGQEIELKKRTANSTLIKLGQDFERYIRDALRKKGLMEVDQKKANSKKTAEPTAKNPCGWLIAAASVWLFIEIFACIFLFDDTPTYRQVVGENILTPLLLISIFVTFILALVTSAKLSPYFTMTKKGLEYSRYLDGLKEYMKLAEAERLKFLQSIKGADTTHQGVVKLYEKLLPYAVLFKLEKSWLKEMGRYYEFDDVSAPAWYIGVGAFSAHDFSAAMSQASSFMAATTTYSTSSNSSSGFSGGGGGGFSGGGGGGGGGGGW